MIDRAAALADIVGPVAVARAPRLPPWAAVPGWLLLSVVLVALVLGGGALLLAVRRRLLRQRARSRLRELASRLRAGAARLEVADVLRDVWRDLRRAGVPPPRSWPQPARTLRQQLLYARHPEPDALRALLDYWLTR